jgi:hypothetical protein
MRTQMSVWMIAAALAGASDASAWEGAETEAALTVWAHVTDYANLSRKKLEGAQAHATAAYRAAGLDVVWSLGLWSPDAESPSIDFRRIDVRIVILSREMADNKCRAARLDDGVLGLAISGATEARGRIVYIFYDRIYHMAAFHNTSIQHGLGHVMAHEIGHVLLGVNSHSAEGLMRAAWKPWDGRVQTFTSNQVLHIRHRFATWAR